MKKSCVEVAKKLLLEGRHITFRDLEDNTDIKSVKLAQRIYDIRHKDGWNVKSKTVKGKGTLLEYWLEKDEIDRIKGLKNSNEQSITAEENPSQMEEKTDESAKEHYVVDSLFPGGHNWGERWS